jgi:hypothetical protein
MTNVKKICNRFFAIRINFCVSYALAYLHYAGMGFVAKASEIYSTFIFWFKVSSNPEDEESMYLRNVGHIANIYILQCA